jgi:signal transduction histidine kinase
VVLPLTPSGDVSVNSHRMLDLRDAVLRVWADQVRAQVARAESVSEPVLIDTMPVLYEHMATILTPAYFARDGIDVSSIAAEHGVERAQLTDFQAETLLAEFQIFRSVLFDMLDAHAVALTGPERRALHQTIDRAVRESIRAFVTAGDQLRERVAGALAHDLRQPVSNVLLAADLILHLDPPAAIADWTRRIVRNGERMTTMLGELLDAMSIQAGDRLRLTLEQFDLYALAHSVAERTRDYQGADVQLTGVSVTGWWNRSALERALENIIGNAHKYGDLGAPIDVTVAENNGRAILSVRNQGKPIPPEEFEAIFQQFVRSKGAGESTTGGWGVGLPYVRAVAQSHGGSAVVYSDAENGTVFVIDVPVDARPFQAG